MARQELAPLARAWSIGDNSRIVQAGHLESDTCWGRLVRFQPVDQDRLPASSSFCDTVRTDVSHTASLDNNVCFFRQAKQSTGFDFYNARISVAC